MHRIIFSTVAFAALAAQASAADFSTRNDSLTYLSPAPAVTWTGFYVGADFGGTFDDSSFHSPVYTVLNATIPGYSRSLSNDGVFGGAHMGLSYQMNSLVLGVQGEFMGVGAVGKVYSPLVDATLKSSQDWLASIDGRIGYAMDRTLLYAIGGVAFTQFQYGVAAGPTLASLIPAGYPTSLSISASRVGYDVGAGIEYAFTRHWRGRIEYRYYNFGSWSPINVPGLPMPHVNQTDSTVRIGMSYMFEAPRNASSY